MSNVAYEEALKCVSMPVHADYSSTGQYCFMTVNSSGHAAKTGDGAKAHGILQDNPAAQGRAGRVAVSGVSKVVFGDTVAEGDSLASDSAGRAVPAGTGDEVLGVAMCSGAEGTVGCILLAVQ